MPTSVETPKQLLCHCQDSLCKGYVQRPVAGIVVETQWTFAEFGGGGSVPGIEKSVFDYRFANEDERPCPHCGGPRELTDQPRPEYPNLSGVPANESIRYLGSFKPDRTRSAEVEAVLARIADAIGG